MFRSFISSHYPDDRYKAYWSFDPLDSSGGVGLIVAPFVSKYIQRIHRYKSRFIAIDLFVPGKKLKVINIYNFQQGDFIRSGKTFAKFIVQHIEEAKKADFKIIIMGDFNLDASVYFDVLTKGRTPPAFFTLTKFLTENDFIDQHSIDSDGLEYASHYVNNRPISRIDQIWFSDDLLSSEYCFDRVWSLSCTEYDTNSIFNLNNLQILSLSYNHITYILDSIGNLTNLQELYLSYNNILTLPDSLSYLNNLKKFYLNKLW